MIEQEQKDCQFLPGIAASTVMWLLFHNSFNKPCTKNRQMQWKNSHLKSGNVQYILCISNCLNDNQPICLGGTVPYSVIYI